MRTEVMPGNGLQYPLSQAVGGGVSLPRPGSSVPARAPAPFDVVRQSPPSQLPARSAPSQSPYAHTASAGPLAAPAVARYFSDIRARLGLPVEELARRLGADPRTLAALEMGSITALPAWVEVERIVRHYLDVLGLDPAPALRVIAAAIAETRLAAPQGSAGALPPPHQASEFDDEDMVGETDVADPPSSWLSRARSSLLATVAIPALGRDRIRGTLRTAAVIGIMVTIAGGTVLAAQTAIRKMNHLPGPAASFMRSASDSVLTLFAPKREGLRWIEVEDPRSRRGDKLQTARR